MIITQNNEAKVVIQDISVLEHTQESLALFKILAQSSNSIQKGKFKPANSALNDIRKKIGQGINL